MRVVVVAVVVTSRCSSSFATLVVAVVDVVVGIKGEAVAVLSHRFDVRFVTILVTLL